MINLVLTTDKLQVIHGTTSTLDVHVSFVDYNGTTVVPGKQNTALTTAATTDVCAAPASSTYRNVKSINIRNKDASIPTTVLVQFNANATICELYKTTVRAGECLQYVEGVGWFLLTDTTSLRLAKVLTADDTGGQAVNTVQPWFPTTGTLTVPAATTYLMRGLLKITSGATTHTTALSFTGSATLTSIGYYAQCHRSAADTIIAVFSGINVSTASSTVVDVTGTQVGHYIQINGIIRINAAGTLIPNFTFSANPTGTITILKNSFFELVAIGDNTFASAGTWA